MSRERRGRGKNDPPEGARSSADYANFSTDLGGMVCCGCHETIKRGELAFTLNHGIESDKYPLKDYMRFSGLAWHAAPARSNPRRPHLKPRDKACIDISKLPGMEGRDEIDTEYFAASVCSGPQARMGARLSPQSDMTH